MICGLFFLYLSFIGYRNLLQPLWRVKLNKFLEIFKPGRHIASDGSAVEFSDADVADIAAGYNPDIHEAPIVVGHPKTNSPAFGWVKGLLFDSGNKILKAIPAQLNADFVEAVKSGAYKKISASIYTKDAPNNPTPGHYYLRHVGLLGAQPPAIKGLRAVEFAESEPTVEVELDFAETELAYNDKGIARLFRNLKNFLIGKFSQEEADGIIPEYALEEIAGGAEQVLHKEDKAATKADFTEGLAAPVAEELQADPETTKALQAAEAKAAELEAKLAKAQADKLAADNKEFCEACIKEGRLLPAMKKDVLSFMDNLAGQELEFSEGKTPLADFKELIKKLPQVVNFSELTPVEESPKPKSAYEIAAKAAQYQSQEAEKGRTIHFSEAVRAVCE